MSAQGWAFASSEQLAGEPPTRMHARYSHIASRPDSATRSFRVMLGGAVPALRILWPIQRQAIADQPLAEICAADRTCRHRSPVLVLGGRGTADRPLRAKVPRSLAAFAPQRYKSLSAPRQSWLLSSAPTPRGGCACHEFPACRHRSRWLARQYRRTGPYPIVAGAPYG
jgi:hypothetical protein